MVDKLMVGRIVFHNTTSCFLFHTNLLVCSSLFLILCRHRYIYLNLAHVYSTNTHVETWIISISRNIITRCTLDEFNTFVVICWLFFKIYFFKASFRNAIRVSNGLFLDQVRRSVGTDLGTNCFQRLSADNKSRHWQEESVETWEIMK